MKKLVSILCAAALVLSLAACGAESHSGGGDAKAAVYSLESATFSDSGITAQDGSYTGYEIDGTTLTIDGAGAYVVTGTCADGSIQIKKGTTGVTLALNGLALTSADTAPILCGKSTEVVIVAADGSTNSLTDAAENNDDSYPDNTEAENAVIKCKDGAQVTLCGGGALTINANGKNGIKSGASTTEEGEASLTIRELTLTINAPVNDAINAQQLLNVESGTLTISADDRVIGHDQNGDDGVDPPAEGESAPLAKGGEGPHGALLGHAAQGGLRHDHGIAEGKGQNDIDQQKNSAAVFGRQIGKAPDVPQAHRGPRRRQDESQLPGKGAALVMMRLHNFTFS